MWATASAKVRSRAAHLRDVRGIVAAPSTPPTMSDASAAVG